MRNYWRYWPIKHPCDLMRSSAVSPWQV